MSNNILIGICELECVNKNKSSWNINKLGGFPDWMHSIVDINCSICHKSLFLICQLYCPLQNSDSHRSLYLLACINQSCWNNSKAWIALRCNTFFKYEKKQNIVKSSAFDQFNFNDLVWGDDCIDYLNCDAEINQNNPDNIDFDTLKLNSFDSACNFPEQNHSSSLSFKSYYINVFNEDDFYSEEYNYFNHENELLQRYLQVEGISILDLEIRHDISPDNGNEQILKDKKNKNFIKYQKAILKFPNQVIRYHYGGEELLVNDSKPIIPNCECGSKRHFEFQLMPSIVKYLHLNDSPPTYQQFEFVSILVYTCSRNCLPGDTSNQPYKEEYIYIEIDDTALHNFK